MKTSSRILLLAFQIRSLTKDAPAQSTSSSSDESLVTCSTQGIIDPNDLNDNDDEFTFQVINSRVKRSVSVILAQKQAKRVSRRNIPREKRQSSADVVVNCETHACVSITCDIRNLATDAATIDFEFNIDERFYGTLANKERYEINTMASVVILSEFQLMGDDTSDNSAVASVILNPKDVEPSDSITLIIHASIWPAIASIIIILIVVAILYFCGFFKRKSYEDEEEIDNTVEPQKDEIVTGL